MSLTSYVQPVHPDPFAISDIGMAQHTVTRFHKDHKDKLRAFHDIIDVQKALTKQIVHTIEPKYLNVLRNRITSTITGDVQKISPPFLTLRNCGR